jgi:hypothetical protein
VFVRNTVILFSAFVGIYNLNVTSEIFVMSPATTPCITERATKCNDAVLAEWLNMPA